MCYVQHLTGDSKNAVYIPEMLDWYTWCVFGVKSIGIVLGSLNGDRERRRLQFLTIYCQQWIGCCQLLRIYQELRPGLIIYPTIGVWCAGKGIEPRFFCVQFEREWPKITKTKWDQYIFHLNFEKIHNVADDLIRLILLHPMTRPLNADHLASNFIIQSFCWDFGNVFWQKRIFIAPYDHNRRFTKRVSTCFLFRVE